MKTNDKQVCLEFTTKEEKKLWINWYKKSGCTSFFCWLTSRGKKGQSITKKKMDTWPKNCEKIIN